MSFQRRRELPGVELRSLANSARAFHCYSTDFEFVCPDHLAAEKSGTDGGQVADGSRARCFALTPVKFFWLAGSPCRAQGTSSTIDARAFPASTSRTTRSPRASYSCAAFTKMSKSLQEKLLELVQNHSPWTERVGHPKRDGRVHPRAGHGAARSNRAAQRRASIPDSTLPNEFASACTTTPARRWTSRRWHERPESAATKRFAFSSVATGCRRTPISSRAPRARPESASRGTPTRAGRGTVRLRRPEPLHAPLQAPAGRDPGTVRAARGTPRAPRLNEHSLNRS